eukprot:6208805-Pleurochrysis_carterae.AAC.2
MTTGYTQVQFLLFGKEVGQRLSVGVATVTLLSRRMHVFVVRSEHFHAMHTVANENGDMWEFESYLALSSKTSMRWRLVS